MGEVHLPVVGVSFEGRPKRVKALAVFCAKGGKPDVFVKPVKNEHDPQAVAVFWKYKDKDYQLGFVPRDVSALVRLAIENKMVKEVRLDDVGHDENKDIVYARIIINIE